mgnify:CR=1 FL=1
MKTLTWKPILSNLEEANGELRTLHWRLHYLEFGELPNDCQRRDDSSYMAWIARDLEGHPFDEGRLFVCMEHAFYHINWAWNCRRTPTVDNYFHRHLRQGVITCGESVCENAQCDGR